MKHAFLSALVMVAATPLAAQELIVGLGHPDFRANGPEEGLLVELEYHAAPFWSVGRADVYATGAAVVDEPGDHFIGIGLGADLPLGDAGWFLTASVVPGFYEAGAAGNDLGSDLQFRSLIGLGYRYDSGWSASGAVSHISNAGLGNSNPGVTIATLRIGRAF